MLYSLDVLSRGGYQRCNHARGLKLRPVKARRTNKRTVVARAIISPEEVTKESETLPTLQQHGANRAADDDTEQSNNLWSLVSDTTSAITSQLYGQLRFWPDLQTIEGKLQQREFQPTGQVLQDASKTIREEQARKRPADIDDFLQVNDVKTLRLLRLLSALCGITYKMHLVTAPSMKRRFNVDLVTTSQACDVLVLDTSQQAEEAVADADGMAASVANVQEVYSNLSCLEENNIVVLPKDVSLSLLPMDDPSPPAPKSWNPADLVQQKLAEAAAAASAAAIAPLGTAAAKLYKATQTLMTSSIPPPAVYLSSRLSNRSEVEGLTDTQAVCPSEWFVCDDADRGVRYFVIQGSDTIDHWKCNLTFDPVVFEDPSLGAKVHRGVYYAALALYDRFLPLVQEHLDSSPFAKICFTGHSLGGSLATLLLLMYRWRNVLPQDRAVVYTFGAPAVFCEGGSECGCGGKCGPCSDPTVGTQPSAQTSTDQDGAAVQHSRPGLLPAVGVKDTDICNVLMHRDIVPRAFACDYSTVAEILKSWGPSFREHCCLQGDPRSMLYNFIGKVMVLQPDRSLVWASAEPYHPMLPEGQELYTLSEPAVPTWTTSSNSEGGEKRRKVRSLREAVLELMDTPHPLEILYDKNSYGPNGAISRYHNPDNYSRALGTLIHHKKTVAARYLAPRPSAHSTPDAVQTPKPSTPSTAENVACKTEHEEDQGNGRAVGMGVGGAADVTPPQLTEDVGTEKVDVSDPEVVVEGKWLAASRLPFLIHARPNILWSSDDGKGKK